MTTQDKKIQEADIKADWLSAIIRVGIFLILIATIIATAVDVPIRHHAILDVAIFGLVTLISFILASKQIYRPWLPFVFATFDVVLVVAHMRFLSVVMSLDAEMFMLPAALFTMIILIHASIRLQPLLVAYIASLFVLTAAIIGQFPISPMMSTTMMDRMREMEVSGHRMMASVLAVELLPSIIIVTAALILIVQNRRARRFLEKSVDEAKQTARLSRFFSPNVAKDLVSLEATDVLNGRRESVVVVFIDIKGFTRISETMPPEELGRLLSLFREKVTECVFQYDGIVDKFIGDAVLVVFGAPKSKPDDPQSAIDCCFSIIDALKQWSKEREAEGSQPIEAGIGAHYGEVLVGVLGSGSILEYTVIGDTVNVAERLERLTREIDTDFVVSQVLLSLTDEDNKEETWAETDRYNLTGRESQLKSFYAKKGKTGQT